MTHEVRRLRLRFAVLLFLVTWSSIAFADRDRTQVGHNLTIGPDEEVGEVTCFGCSIRVRGHVSGDATAFGGSIVVRRDPAATVGGDVTNMGGHGWIFLIFLTPLIFLGLFLALIFWLIRRMLRPSVSAAA
jgi:hypothetical protein